MCWRHGLRESGYRVSVIGLSPIKVFALPLIESIICYAGRASTVRVSSTHHYEWALSRKSSTDKETATILVVCFLTLSATQVPDDVQEVGCCPTEFKFYVLQNY